jgi:hypothetical protein
VLKWIEDLHEGLAAGHFSKRLIAETAASAVLLGSFITLALVILFDSQRYWAGLKGVAALALTALVARAAISLWIYLGSKRHDDALRI